jgi:hypothetical protein
MVLARALAKVPEKRFGSCGEFAEALRAALGLAPYDPRGTGTGAVPAAAPGHPPTMIAAPPPEAVPAPAAPAPADLAAPVTMDSSRGWPPAVPAPAEPVPAPPTIPVTTRQPTSPRRRRRILVITLAGAVLAAAAITGTLLASALKPRSPALAISPAAVSGPKPIATLTAHGTITVNAVAFSPDGATLAAAAENGKTYLWNVAARTPSGTISDSGAMTAVAFGSTRTGAILITGDNDENVNIWNASTGNPIITYYTNGYGNTLNSVAVGPAGKMLAAANNLGALFLVNLQITTPTALTPIFNAPNESPMNSVAFSPNGAKLAAADENGKIYQQEFRLLDFIGVLWHN